MPYGRGRGSQGGVAFVSGVVVGRIEKPRMDSTDGWRLTCGFERAWSLRTSPGRAWRRGASTVLQNTVLNSIVGPVVMTRSQSRAVARREFSRERQRRAGRDHKTATGPSAPSSGRCVRIWRGRACGNLIYLGTYLLWCAATAEPVCRLF